MFRRYLFRAISTSCRRACDETIKPKSSKAQELLENATTFQESPVKATEDQWATMPYPVGTVFGRQRDQAAKAIRPKTDPRETSLMLFPGQGAQYVGMGAEVTRIPEARDMYELASDVLGYDLLKLCLEGPRSKLDETRHAQPAILVTSLACLERLREERPTAIDTCVGAAGFSLGEITALVFTGAIAFDDAVRLVQIRGEAMQLAADRHRGGMATVLYGPDSRLGAAVRDALEWCIQRGVDQPDCRIANYLYPHCKVVAGSEDALRFLETNAKTYKLRRVRRLPVAGAFHSALMDSAVEPFKRALARVDIQTPAVPVYSNVDSTPYRDADHIRRQLPRQITRAVQWEQTMHVMYSRQQGEHFPCTFEVGPGGGLKAILKQVNAKAWDHTHCIEP